MPQVYCPELEDIHLKSLKIVTATGRCGKQTHTHRRPINDDRTTDTIPFTFLH